MPEVMNPAWRDLLAATGLPTPAQHGLAQLRAPLLLLDPYLLARRNAFAPRISLTLFRCAFSCVSEAAHPGMVACFGARPWRMPRRCRDVRWCGRCCSRPMGVGHSRLVGLRQSLKVLKREVALCAVVCEASGHKGWTQSAWTSTWGGRVPSTTC